MKLDLTDMLFALSFALDAVEQELTGATTSHAKRVAYMVLLMAEKMGIPKQEMNDLVSCAILHDNAIAEYIQEERRKVIECSSPEEKLQIFGRHCIIGEENLKLFPFHADMKNIILYHHENADGSGPFHKKAYELDWRPQMLHIADVIDMRYDLQKLTKADYDELARFVKEEKELRFSSKMVEVFLEAVTYEQILGIQEFSSETCLREHLVTKFEDYSNEEIHGIATFFARIVDYKSSFTRKHSMGVAQAAEIMARYYGFPEEKVIRFYFAGAMHDIGKLIVTNDILEKPGKLDEQEFSIMKNHAQATYELMRKIKGLEDITVWAAHHHEKLNGSGYPFGLTKDQLSMEERLMTCIDIHEALTEARPYKEGLSHEKSIEIMREMVQNGEVDGRIVDDIEIVLSDENRKSMISETVKMQKGNI